MKTGLESLDTGAPEITYSGNQGPKSPQEDQQKMAEFQLQEYMEEFERVFPDMKDRRGTPDYMKELQDYFEGLASKQDEGIGNMAMKPGLIDEYRNYKMGQEEAGEPFMSPRDYYRSLEQDRMDVKEGGIMRTAFQGGGRDAGAGSGFGGGGDRDDNREQSMQDYMTNQSKLSVGPSTISDAGAARALANNPSLQAGVDRAAIAKAEIARFNKEKMRLEKLALDKQLQENTRKNKFNKGISTVAKAFVPLPIRAIMAINKFRNPPQTTQDYLDDDTITGITDTQAADYFENINKPPAPPFTGGGDGQDFISPTMAQIAGPTTTDLNVAEDVTGDENTFELRPDDFVSRFSIPDQFRQRAAFGGIMGLDGRRAYGLGSKLKRAFKKITKSPIGKALLLYGGYQLGGMKFGTADKSLFSRVGSLFGSGGAKKARLDMLTKYGLDEKKFAALDISDKIALNNQISNVSKKPGLGTMAAIVAPAIAGGLYTKKTEENQPTLDEAMAQTSRGASPFDQYNGVQGFRDMINKGNLDRSMFPFLQPTSYAADGGRIGLKEGGIGDLRGALSKEMFGYDDEDEDIIKLALGGSAGMPPVTMMSDGANSMSFPDDESTGMAQATTTLPNQMPRQKPMMDPRMMQQMMMASKMNPQMGNRMMAAMGGRMGYSNGGSLSEFEIFKLKNLGYTNADDPIRQQEYGGIDVLKDILRVNRAMGGRMNYAEGGDEGELLDMGGMEKDYRNDGGFVPMGEYERKDDVPARLSKNEFVFTADAVRNAGGGDIDKGAEIMENMMTNLENGGKVSQGSQGLDGAREMFATQQRLEEVL